MKIGDQKINGKKAFEIHLLKEKGIFSFEYRFPDGSKESNENDLHPKSIQDGLREMQKMYPEVEVEP